MHFCVLQTKQQKKDIRILKIKSEGGKQGIGALNLSNIFQAQSCIVMYAVRLWCHARGCLVSVVKAFITFYL